MADRTAPGWVNMERLEKIAVRLRKGDPTLTKEQSIAKAAEKRQDIVRAYHREAQDDLNHGSTTR